MTAITLHLRTANEIKLVEQLAKTLNLDFEKNEEKEMPYNQEFVDKILQGKKDMKNGLGKNIKTKDLWK